MKTLIQRISLVFILLVVTTLQPVCAQVKLPHLISDGMVLQRDAELKLWGWASSGEKISVKFNKKTYNTLADHAGNWQVTLPAQKAGGPHTMEIIGKNEITLKNILIGDVWLCSGQSNMELNMQRAAPLYGEEIANSAHEFIRYYRVPYKYDFHGPVGDLQGGEWQSPDPETVLSFGAVAYFFAKELYSKYKVPIGIINSAMGGSPIQAWISEGALKRFPEYYDETMKFRDADLIEGVEKSDRAMSQAWHTKLGLLDEGYRKGKTSWRSPDYDDSAWPTMEIPGYWADGPLGPVNGAVWFRKEFEVPASMAGKPAKLLLGRIVDSDSVFVNGAFVGTTGYQYPPRRYQVPANVLKTGKNSLVVRVISQSGNGGFVEDKAYKMYTETDTINLNGEWRYKLGVQMDPLPGQMFIRWKPMGLYNGMIAPLTNYVIKGAVWYQGESNEKKPREYYYLLPALIKDWREKWGHGEFPFLIAQLPNYMEAKAQPSESNWAILREAQLKALAIPNTGLAVTIDLGEWNDIHPLNKKDVGKRLALTAQKVAYGDKKIVHSGPMYKSKQIDGSKIILTFSHTGSGLMAKGDELGGFVIAGEDKKFVWAKARIEGDKVVVWHENIKNPAAVRYAWADNPDTANLYNKEGLPASPFRTDNWQLTEVVLGGH